MTLAERSLRAYVQAYHRERGALEAVAAAEAKYQEMKVLRFRAEGQARKFNDPIEIQEATR